MKHEMFNLFRNGQVSDDQPYGSQMYYAMYAYELHGDATRDNSFSELVQIGIETEARGDK